jgi:rod shape determining protein RodA
MIDRRLIINFDWPLMIMILIMTGISVLNLYSATYSIMGEGLFPFYLRQLLWICFGFFLMILSITVDYRVYDRYANFIFAFSLGLLIIVLIIGQWTSGSRRWIDFGFISFQPSEFSKIALILALTHYFHVREKPAGYSIRELLLPFSFTGATIILILVEPDLGTAIIVGLIAISMILFAGVRLKSLLIISGIILVCLPSSWFLLKEYQKKRVETFFNPDLDPLGAGYHLIQSKIAIGSGGLIGKGYLQGTQSHLHFLPAQHTDFIFSVLAEEWGFLGSFFLLSLFLIFIIYSIRISSRARDNIGIFLSFGISSMFFWPWIINIGMTTGILPVVGVALPFISYGGSSMLTSMLGAGLLMNISMRRYIF